MWCPCVGTRVRLPPPIQRLLCFWWFRGWHRERVPHQSLCQRSLLRSPVPQRRGWIWLIVVFCPAVVAPFQFMCGDELLNGPVDLPSARVLFWKEQLLDMWALRTQNSTYHPNRASRRAQGDKDSPPTRPPRHCVTRQTSSLLPHSSIPRWVLRLIMGLTGCWLGVQRYDKRVSLYVVYVILSYDV